MVRWSVVIVLVAFFLFGNYSVEDLKYAVKYYGESITQSHPTIGIIILISIISIMIFSEELFHYFIILKNKVRVKQNF